MAYVGTESKKEWIYVHVELVPFAVQQKLTQHCTSTILQENLILNNFFKNPESIKIKSC